MATKGLKNYFYLRIESFSSHWYAAVMGIGISAAILYSFPFPAHWLRVVGVILFGVAIGVFAVSTVASVLHMIMFPRRAGSIMFHPPHAVFLGCVPMGFATIVNMTHNIWGADAWKATYAMWWIDVFMSVFCSWGVVFVMFAHHDWSLKTVNPTILLPVVAIVVASASGTLIAEVQPQDLQPSSIIISLLLWANGELLAFTFITTIIIRLLLAKLPDKPLTISLFLPTGPLGQGTFSILNATMLGCEILTTRGVDAATVSGLRFLGLLIAFILMGFASFWIIMSFFGLLINYPTKFTLGWWGLTFPLGTYVLGWYRLADLTDLYAFKFLGAFFGALEVMFMLLCTVLSVQHGLIEDALFVAAGKEIDKWIAKPKNEKTDIAALV